MSHSFENDCKMFYEFKSPEHNYNKKILSQLVDSSNKYFKKLNSSGYISYKEMKYFTYEYKKPSNLGKLYLLSKIHKRLFKVPGRLVFLIAERLLRRPLSFWTMIERSILHKRLSTFFRKNKNYWKCS